MRAEKAILAQPLFERSTTNLLRENYVKSIKKLHKVLV